MRERSGKAAVAAIAAVWLVSTALWLRPGLVIPDGAGYVVYLPSAFLDRDLLFFNEWSALGMVRGGQIQHKEITATDHLGNHWTVGSALAWFPAFAAADLARFAGPLERSFPRNGIALPYNVAVVATSALAGLVTLLLGYRAARVFTTPGVAALAACAIWVGTPLMWYSLAHATMAHAISAMAAALVFVAALMLREKQESPAVMLAGLAAGFAFAVRPQNGVLVLVPLIVASIPLRRLPVYAAGFVVAALPQLVVSFVLYGAPLGFLTGGSAAKPFAGLERIWWWEPLFSWYHGLFTWTPFAAVGVLGLFVLMRRDARLATAGLYLFAAQWAINAAMERSFWGAMAFGQRRFDTCIVVFLIGAAALFDAVPRWVRVPLVLLPAGWTFATFLAAYTGALDLVRYHPAAEHLAQVVEGLRRAPATLVPLASTPAEFRPRVALLVLIAWTMTLLVAIFMVRTSRRTAATILTAYFAVAALFLGYCGLRDQSRMETFRPLIDGNRFVRDLPGGADVRFGLLADEADYLRRSGRTAEAEATDRELEALRRQREEALRRLGR